MIYYCIEDIKGFTTGKPYRASDKLYKEKMPSNWSDFYGNHGTAPWDKYKTQTAWHGGHEDIQDYNYRVAAMNGYIKKRKKSENTKKRRKKPLIDLIDNNGHIKSLREGQIKRHFTSIKSEVDAIIRDRKLNKLVK